MKLNKVLINQKLAEGWRLGWKVTDDFKSYMYASIREGARVLYAIKQTTKPNDGCGPLGVFTSLKEAQKFLDDGCSYYNGVCRLHRCVYKPSKEAKFFDGDKETDPVGFGFGDGTVDFADAVILLNTRMTKG